MFKQRDIEFLYEMGSIRLIKRMWYRFFNTTSANLAEHHFRTFWIAMTIAAGEKNVDTGKIAKMVLVHDIAESRTGDVDYLSRQYVKRNEELGIKDMLQNTVLEQEFLELWEEYETRETLEAKIVKDADTLDVDFELAEFHAQGNNLFDELSSQREKVKATLFTESAKKLYKEFKKPPVNPHSWHTNGRNRLNNGDWSHLK